MLFSLFILSPPPEGGLGIPLLPYMGYVGMCDPKAYGFSAVLVINRVSIWPFLVLNRVWFLGMFLEETTIDKTINKSPSKIMFRASVSAVTVINRVPNFWSGHK